MPPVRDVQGHQPGAAKWLWNAIEAVEPGLVEELLQFFSTSDAASLWLLKASGANQPCPAKAIAEGGAAEVRERVLRTLHGSAA